MTDATPPSCLHLDGIPPAQVMSFLTHDVCGPTAMLATYLGAVSSTVTDEALRAQLADAERLAREVSGLQHLLHALVAVSSGALVPALAPVTLAELLSSLDADRLGLVLHTSAQIGDDTRIIADPRLLTLAVEGLVWQMARMGARQGPVNVGAVSVEEGCPPRLTLGLWRADDAVDADLLARAMEGRDDDWASFLRRLPACDFPFRVARRVVTAMGGELAVRRESRSLALTLPQPSLP